jgi:hypothetical protein
MPVFTRPLSDPVMVVRVSRSVVVVVVVMMRASMAVRILAA